VNRTRSQSAFNVLEQVAAAKAENERDDKHAGETGDVILFTVEMRTNYNEPKKDCNCSKPQTPSRRHQLVPFVGAHCSTYMRPRPGPPLLGGNPRRRSTCRRCPSQFGSSYRRSRKPRGRIRWLEDLANRHPTFYPATTVNRLAARGTAKWRGIRRPPAEPIIRRLIDHVPTMPGLIANWPCTSSTRTQRRAFAELDIARRIEPDNPSNFYTLGHLCTKTDRVAEREPLTRTPFSNRWITGCHRGTRQSGR
jgi:hypothetical protein